MRSTGSAATRGDQISIHYGQSQKALAFAGLLGEENGSVKLPRPAGLRSAVAANLNAPQSRAGTDT